MEIDIMNKGVNSTNIIVARSQFEPIQMPVCMELGSSVHLAALANLIERRKHFNTGGFRSLPNCVHATNWCACMIYSAESYVIFNLGCVSLLEQSNFSVFYFAAKQSSLRTHFLNLFLMSTAIPVFVCVIWHNSTVAFGCMWALFVSLWWLCYRTSRSEEHTV